MIAIPLSGLPRLFPKVPYEQAVWTSCERKVWACLKDLEGRRGIRPGEEFSITNRMGAQWCSEKFGGSRYGSTGRRTFAKGLQRLEARGAISRHRAHGGRTIVTLIPFQGPKANYQPGATGTPRAKGKDWARKGRTGPAPGPPSREATLQQLAAALAANTSVDAPIPEAASPDTPTPAEVWAREKARKEAEEKAEARKSEDAEIARRRDAARDWPKCPDDPTRWRAHWAGLIELIESLPLAYRTEGMRRELPGMKAWLADWDAPDVPDDRTRPARE
jgi:hypothetical protein